MQIDLQCVPFVQRNNNDVTVPREVLEHFGFATKTKFPIIIWLKGIQKLQGDRHTGLRIVSAQQQRKIASAAAGIDSRRVAKAPTETLLSFYFFESFVRCSSIICDARSVSVDIRPPRLGSPEGFQGCLEAPCQL